VTGFVVHLQHQKHGNSLLTAVAAPPAKPALSLGMANGGEEAKPAERKTLMKRLSNISETAVHDFVDIAVFLILGAVIAAFAKLYIKPEDMTALSKDMPFLAIPIMMLLAILMCLCSEADAFVAASFVELHISAKLAFLVLGPMLDLKLLLMYTRVFKPRLIATIVTCTVVQVLIYCMIVHVVYQVNGWSGLTIRAAS